MLFVFVYVQWCQTHIIFYFSSSYVPYVTSCAGKFTFLRLMYHMLPVSLVSLLLIVSNFYLGSFYQQYFATRYLFKSYLLSHLVLVANITLILIQVPLFQRQHYGQILVI
jgi:hypothetical protein